MTSEKSTLRIKAEKLGTVAEVTSLLTDLEFAYNSIYAFDFLVETLTQERERNIRQVDERFYMLRKFWREFSDNKEKTFEPYIFEMFFEDYIFNRTNNISQSLLELQSKIVIDKVVLTKDRLMSFPHWPLRLASKMSFFSVRRESVKLILLSVWQ